MARKLLPCAFVVLAGAAVLSAHALSGGCIVPPELQVGFSDAGPGSPPVILSAGPAPDFSFPGPIILDRQDARTLSLTVSDNDVEDVVYVRLFVDYGVAGPEPAYAECQAASTGEAIRIVACPMNAVCNAIDGADLDDHVLEAMVADREFLSDSDPAAEGQPQFRALREPSIAAFSFRAWTMRCNLPPEL